MRPYGQVIIRPLLTEKNAVLKETLNKVAFEVAPNANKIEIKKAVEEAFKVSVDSVNILNVRGKIKRLGRSFGKRRDWKKAVVTLKKGSTIEFFEGI
ncbi:MAG: 50S ribosomal protein L23 [bacterium]|nr:50S ribosomal protein L23 [bacterium]MDT8395882.1 50S ribosomal protein L23 [bacterium]